MKIVHVVGTRPNIVKTAPVVAALSDISPETDQVIIHTGQHYDRNMSEIFFEQLGVRDPDHYLEVGSGTHAEQTARTMERIEPLLAELEPDLVLVPGDVNSSLAAALTATKMGIEVGHVESGLRSFDRSMPEEVNRLLVDQIAGILFTHSESADLNLDREGIPAERVHFVGNTMIDTLVRLEDVFRTLDAASALGLGSGDYLLVTLHRPALVDTPLLLEAIDQLESIAREIPVVFPVHPRTRAAIPERKDSPGLQLVDPVGYLEFLSLEADAAAVLTDSGGIQEETTYLGVPCFTLRDNTERPITVELGTNTLLGLDPERIGTIPSLLAETDGSRGASEVPPLWDGRAGERVAEVLTGQSAAG